MKRLEKIKQQRKNSRNIQVIEKLCLNFSRNIIINNEFLKLLRTKQMIGGKQFSNDRLVIAQYFWHNRRWNIKRTWCFVDHELITGSSQEDFNKLIDLISHRYASLEFTDVY